MKTLSLVAGLSLVVAAACGGTVVVEPIGGGNTSSGNPASSTSSSGGSSSGSTPTTPTPKAPIGPYTGLVGTSDVSILYPMPLAGQAADFVRASDVGDHGPLFANASFTATAGTSLDRTTSDPPSGYAQLALISMRLDPCSTRKGSACTSEVRLVLQGVYERKAGGFSPDGDATLGMAASDGALHVTYDISEAELVVMMKQILTLKQANGGAADQVLGVHPILASQGLAGPFAVGLRAIVLEHLGEDRIARVTTFDHNMDPDEDGWSFRVFDRAGSAYTPLKIPTTTNESQTVFGSSAFGTPLTSTGAGMFIPATTADSVERIVDRNRPALGAPQVASQIVPAFEAAARVQNPSVHHFETIDCATCHLAEGAKLIGQDLYGLSTLKVFTHKRVLEYKSERTSVTNLHAFGYLHRKVSIMQRTANESVLVADAMEQKVK
ncbi:MAG: hypothetical protein JST00_12520 [Deltaproteobacteria bacterium]|nr:hypothetical protein [Deltaproteobacteria bacterium]